MLTKLGLIFALIACASAVYFDCRRTGQPCQNSGTCNRDTGNCTCSDLHTGYDCGLTKSTLVGAVCNPECQNNGQCTTSGTCYCPEEFYGPQCQNRRAEASCTGNSLNVIIVPFGAFAGIVYVKENRTSPSCAFEEKTVDGVTGYYANLTFDGGCSIVSTQPNADQQKYQTDVIVQNSAIFETSYDITVDVSCTQGTTGQASIGGGVGALAVDEAANLTEDATSTTYEPVSLELLQEDGSAIPDKLFLGTPLKLLFKLSDTQKFKKINVASCTATDGSINATIIEAGCPTPTGQAILAGPITRTLTPLPQVSVPFNAFRFPSSSTVNFQCSVSLCETDDDTKCAEPQCVGARKKRSVDESSKRGGSVVVKKEVTVFDATEKGALELEEMKTVEDVIRPEGKEPQPQANGEECLLSNEILAVVIALVVAVVFLLVATLCLATKFIKSRTLGKRMDGPLPMSGPKC